MCRSQPGARAGVEEEGRQQDQRNGGEVPQAHERQPGIYYISML